MLTYVLIRVIMHVEVRGLKRRDIDKKLKDAGWIITPGKKYDMAKHPNKPGVKIPLPRHKEINEYTAQGILEQAGA